MSIVEPELKLRGFSISCELVALLSYVITTVLVVDTRVFMVVVVI